MAWRIASGSGSVIGVFALVVLGGCSSSGTEPAPRKVDPGTPVSAGLGAEAQAEVDKVAAEAAATKAMTADELLTRYAVPFAQALPFDPSTAENLALLQASKLSLNAAELSGLKTHGFVISERHRYPTFTYGYEAIYAEDLPLYVSADSIMTAVHQSYDHMLKATEQAALIPELSKFLASLRSALGAGGAAAIGADAAKDCDLYLAVAQALLDGTVPAPVAGADAATVQSLYDKAFAAQGEADVELFGVTRTLDFSQFTPRGHYTDTPELGRYFQSMMWLGRVDFRLVETQSDGSQVFHRRQLEGAAALRALTSPDSLARHARIDDTIRTFVGEPDSMTLTEMDALLAAVGAATPADLGAHSDDELAQAVITHAFGAQRISSDIMINDSTTGTLPLNRSFLLFGQRYVVDSEVLSNVVFDRVAHGAVMRMMPDPLDVAFAALGNDQAASLLGPELKRYPYAPDLHMARFMVGEHGADFWQKNMYSGWMGALRALSPGGELSDPVAAGLPAVATTDAWGRRLMNTQLASWAELRHDTILYAKQSYTGGASCTFPDGYVEPYPAFWDGLVTFAGNSKEALAKLDYGSSTYLASAIDGYFTQLSTTATLLGDMARRQRTGAALDQAQIDYLNQAVHVQMGCGDPEGADGWYAQLFFDMQSAVQFDPTIADVHTQPTDEAGNMVGRVLHVGTGSPRLMVVTLEGCNGPRAYVGVASSYFERITENFERLDDIKWQTETQAGNPVDVSWMTDLVVR